MAHLHPPSPPAERNRLLAALPRPAYDMLVSRLERVDVAQKQMITSAGERITHAYFPRGAVISVLAPMEDGTAIESATIGAEGLAGLPLYLGDGVSNEEVICQVGGSAARLSAESFRQATAESPALRLALRHYTLALMGQMARTAGCNRVHPVEERCARWLLMTQDRVGRDSFNLTHEFLAAMLGTRRASVTIVAGQLAQAGLIRYRRGQMTILDREGLEDAACEDYRLTRDIYERLYVGHEGGAVQD